MESRPIIRDGPTTIVLPASVTWKPLTKISSQRNGQHAHVKLRTIRQTKMVTTREHINAWAYQVRNLTFLCKIRIIDRVSEEPPWYGTLRNRFKMRIHSFVEHSTMSYALWLQGTRYTPKCLLDSLIFLLNIYLARVNKLQITMH